MRALVLGLVILGCLSVQALLPGNWKTISSASSLRLSSKCLQTGAILPTVEPRSPLYASLAISASSFVKPFSPASPKSLALIAKATRASSIKGWDLFGRVPHDDWLFKTENLINPNLLKPSFVEAVVREIPDAMANFRRKRFLFGVLSTVKGLAVISTALAGVSWWFWNKKSTWRLLREQEIRERGFATPIGATIKGRRLQGKRMASDNEWTVLDKELMDLMDDEEAPTPSAPPAVAQRQTDDTGGPPTPPVVPKGSSPARPSPSTPTRGGTTPRDTKPAADSRFDEDIDWDSDDE